MNNFTFQIDNIIIPIRACLDFSQDYSDISAVSTSRTMNGSAIIQGTYKKLKTTLSGAGTIPPGLSSLDVFIPHTLKCAAPRCIPSDTNIIILPSSRRTDAGYEPFGIAIKDGESYKVDVSLDGNIATLDILEGAQGYNVFYVPQITVSVKPMTNENTNLRTKNSSWSLECEEV